MSSLKMQNEAQGTSGEDRPGAYCHCTSRQHKVLAPSLARHAYSSGLLRLLRRHLAHLPDQVLPQLPLLLLTLLRLLLLLYCYVLSESFVQ